jgi:hypothetical protein
MKHIPFRPYTKDIHEGLFNSSDHPIFVFRSTKVFGDLPFTYRRTHIQLLLGYLVIQ